MSHAGTVNFPPSDPYPSIPQALGLTLGYFCLLTIVAGLLHALPEPVRPTPATIVLLAVGLVTTGLLVYGVKRSGETWAHWRASWLGGAFAPVLLLPTLLTVAGLSIVGSELHNLMVHLLPPPAVLRQASGGTTPGVLELLVFMGVVVPLGHELLFRGLILTGLRRWVGDQQAIFMCAGLYMVSQAHMPYHFGGTLLLGWFLAWLVVRGGSLRLAIIAHCAYYLVPLLLMTAGLLAVPGYASTSGDTPAATFQPAWFNAAGVCLLIAGWRLFRHFLPPPPSEEPAPADDTDDDDEL